MTCTARVTPPSTMPLATSLLLRQRANAAITKTPSGITNTGSHPSQNSCSKFLAGNKTDGRRARPRMEKANTPAEITTPDAKPAAFFPTLLGVHSARRPNCFVTQLLAVIAVECLRTAVVPPSAHNSDSQSLSMKSSSRSIALPQH